MRKQKNRKITVTAFECKRGRLTIRVNIKCLSDYLLAPAEGLDGCAVINYSGLTLDLLSKF